MDERTIIYNNVHHGDWLRCNNCETNMLLPIGADKCPECGAEGTFEYVNNVENFHTVDATDIGFPNYLDDDVDIEECFSKEALAETYPELVNMEYTNMRPLFQKIRSIETQELISAVKAHKGLYQFGYETDDGECDLGECPIVTANPDTANPNPIDVYILQVRLIGEDKDVLEIYGIEKENNTEIYLSPDEIAVEHIPFIIDFIRMTDKVKSVCCDISFNVTITNGNITIK